MWIFESKTFVNYSGMGEGSRKTGLAVSPERSRMGRKGEAGLSLTGLAETAAPDTSFFFESIRNKEIILI